MVQRQEWLISAWRQCRRQQYAKRRSSFSSVCRDLNQPLLRSSIRLIDDATCCACLVQYPMLSSWQLTLLWTPAAAQIQKSPAAQLFQQARCYYFVICTCCCLSAVTKHLTCTTWQQQPTLQVKTALQKLIRFEFVAAVEISKHSVSAANQQTSGGACHSRISRAVQDQDWSIGPSHHCHCLVCMRRRLLQQHRAVWASHSSSFGHCCAAAGAQAVPAKRMPAVLAWFGGGPCADPDAVDRAGSVC